MKKFALLFTVLLVSHFAVAQEAEEPMAVEMGPAFKVHAASVGVGLNISRTAGIAGGGFGLIAGAKYSFFFSPKVGVFTGVDYTQRGGKDAGLEFSTSTIDIPFGLTFRYRNMLDGQSATYLGGYYALPLAGKAEDANNSFVTEGESHFGIVFVTETFFPVNDSFHLGFSGGLKIGFGDTISTLGGQPEPSDNTSMDVVLGLVGRF